MKMLKAVLPVFMVLIVAVFVSSAIVSAQPDANATGTDRCAACHKEQKAQWDAHAHATAPHGGCEFCHGSGKEHEVYVHDNPTPADRKKGEMKIVINKKSELCGQCHVQTKDNSIVTVSADMIKSGQQYNEMMYNKKAQLKMTCQMCHDAHSSSKTKEGLRRTCLVCHTGKYAMDVKIKAMAGLSCEACHMPYAAKKSSDEMIGEYHKGDVRSHIFGISVDEDYKLDDGTGKVSIYKNKDDFETARLTIEMTCYACHKTGKAQDKTLKELYKAAKKIHD